MSRLAASRHGRMVRLAAWLVALVLVAWPAGVEAQPGPVLPPAPLPSVPRAGEVLPQVQPVMAELPPARVQDPCLPAAVAPNPLLPESLLPNPLLPAPNTLPQTFCDGPFGCEGMPAACPPPRWLAGGGAVFLNRSGAFAQPLLLRPTAEQIGGAEQAVEFNASDFDFDLQAGPLVDLMFLSPWGWQLEARYFDVAAWNARQDFNATSPLPIGRLVFGEQSEPLLVQRPLLIYESDLYSTEFNFRRPLAPWCIGMIGFRWVEFEEQYAAGGLDPFVPSPEPVRIGYDVNYTTHNHMYGLQLGADMKLFDRGGPLRIDSTVKAGVYYNDADLRAVRATYEILYLPGETVPLGAIGSADSDEQSHTSFLGEITVGATWQVAKCLAVRGGWQMLWLEGVALAPEQLSTTTLGDPLVEGSTSRAVANTHGGAFYHGPYAAIEAVW